MPVRRYENYVREDFLEDEHFTQWVLQPQEQSDTFWEKVLLQHPQKKAPLEEARRFILLLHGLYTHENHTAVSTNDIEEAFSKLKAALSCKQPPSLG